MSDVLVIANNLNQASYRLRVEAIRKGLADRGINLDIQLRPRQLLARRRLLNSAAQYDAVLLQRKLLDPSHMSLLRRRAKKIFFDVDDAVMFSNRPVGMIARWRNWRRFLATASNVDRVVAGNDYLSQIFAARGAATTILPTVVDPACYRVKAHGPTPAPALVWIGSRSTLPYLQELSPVLAEAAKIVSGLRLAIIADQTLGLPLPVEHVPWSLEGEAEALCRADIGIAPMPIDRWTLGKCGFKIVQYMAAGLPVIASPVGANADIVLPDQTGFLPETPQEWLDAITALSKNPDLRAAMGQAGRRRVEQHFSLDRAVETWAKLLG